MIIICDERRKSLNGRDYVRAFGPVTFSNWMERANTLQFGLLTGIDIKPSDFTGYEGRVGIFFILRNGRTISTAIFNDFRSSTKETRMSVNGLFRIIPFTVQYHILGVHELTDLLSGPFRSPRQENSGIIRCGGCTESILVVAAFIILLKGFRKDKHEVCAIFRLRTGFFRLLEIFKSETLLRSWQRSQ